MTIRKVSQPFTFTRLLSSNLQIMEIHSFIEAKYAEQTENFTQSRAFNALEIGTAAREDYDKLIANICRTHLKSPQILAFLYAAAPPKASENLKHNMLEELGLDGSTTPPPEAAPLLANEGNVSHPALLFRLAEAAGFNRAAQKEFEETAQEELRRMASDPIMFGTLKEVALSVLLETTCFEWMLSRTAGRMAAFLEKHRGLNRTSLEWFLHHSEVDIRHAEEGLQAVVDYIEFYEFDTADVEVILDVTFRENVFLKRYFSEMNDVAPPSWRLSGGHLARQTHAVSERS